MQTPELLSRCWAEISRAALRHNARLVRERIGATPEILAVVKANAYGHGMADIALALADDVQLFGVANLEEALLLRESIAWKPILILGPALPEERRAIIEHGFVPAISSFEEAAAYAHELAGRRLAINFVIDTGMGRMGTWHEAAVAEFAKISQLAGLQVHSISTHLPVADEDAEWTRVELAQFRALANTMRPAKIHVLLSAGILAFANEAFDLVRAGLMLYGSSPLPEFQHLLAPVMTLKSRIVLLRDVPAGRGISYGRTFITPAPMRVATLSAGYADGYPRALSNRGAEVLIGGKRCAVLGRVTMDLLMVDVTHVPAVAVGDEAVLIGRQSGEEILATEIATRAGTIAWEIFTGIGSRVRRVYL